MIEDHLILRTILMALNKQVVKWESSQLELSSNCESKLSCSGIWTGYLTFKLAEPTGEKLANSELAR